VHQAHFVEMRNYFEYNNHFFISPFSMRCKVRKSRVIFLFLWYHNIIIIKAERKHMKVLQFSKKLILRVYEDDIFGTAARMAYSLVLSIIPLLMLIMTICARMDLPITEIFSYLKFILPTDAFNIVKSIVEDIMSSGDLTVYTILTLVYFISIGARAILSCLTKAYRDEESRPIWKIWILSFIFAVLFAFLLVLSLVVMVFGEVVSRKVFQLLGLGGRFSAIWGYLRYLLSYVVLVFVFSMIYMAAISRRISFKEVLPGAAFSGLLWALASLIFAVYVNNFSKYGLLYGSLGGIFILLVYLYMTSFILLLGGEINALITEEK